MGATRDDFVKYPRTPHLFGSKGTDDAKHLVLEAMLSSQFILHGEWLYAKHSTL